MTDSNAKRPKNFDVLTAVAPCPACGAPVNFAAVTSVMSVCEYCQTTVVRDGEDFRSQGKQSQIIEDYSPLQIGSAGSYKGTDFTLIGRVQMAYDAGTWNEWRVQFVNGHVGWLSEALGKYTLTAEGRPSQLPAYTQLSVNQTVDYNDKPYRVTDKRSATVVGCEGELPVINRSGEPVYVIDARFQRQFITLDYAAAGPDRPPVVFSGIATTLEALKMQRLKDNRQLNEDSNLGNDQKELDKLDCPNCGYAVPYVAGATTCLMCPACRGEIQFTGNKAEVLQLHSMTQMRETSLELGDTARIREVDIDSVSSTRLNDPQAILNSDKAHDYVVIGIMELEEVGEDSLWTEYLLYSFTDGFLWLAEESGGWFVSRVLNELPAADYRQLTYRGKKWRQPYESYANAVTYAIGAFNWQVHVGDAMLLTDYRNGNEVITSEQNDEEITYTLSIPVAIETVGKWFGRDLRPKRQPPKRRENNLNTIWIVLIILFFLLPLLLNNCHSSGVIVTGGWSGGGYYSSGSSRSGFSSSGSHK